jgi:Glycosyl transferases group 1
MRSAAAARVALSTVAFLRRSDRALPQYLSVGWPSDYTQPGSHFPAGQILAGLRQLGVPVEFTEVPQTHLDNLVLIRIGSGEESDLVAFDHDDSPEIEQDVASRVLVYFKQQYAIAGYNRSNVVPAGYTTANNLIYRYLPLLRTIRSLGRFRYDVYCRFGLQWGGQEIRQQAHELLSARTDFRYEGSLFRYAGGPEKVPYRKYLFEIPRAKVCVDMPGAGDFCTRLIDYLAVGACVVKPPPQSRLPVELVDGVHVVYCQSDLSDLGDVCAQLVRDEETRESIAHNARDFFDRHLHRRQLVERYVDEITHAQAGAARALSIAETRAVAKRRYATAARPAVIRRSSGQLARTTVMAALVILLTLIALPEALGDRPFDPRPTRVLAHHHV